MKGKIKFVFEIEVLSLYTGKFVLLTTAMVRWLLKVEIMIQFTFNFIETIIEKRHEESPLTAGSRKANAVYFRKALRSINL